MSLDGQRPTRAPEWVSIHEAALLMGVSPATLRRWSDAGDIRTFTTPGGHRRFSLTAIAGLLPAVGPQPASRDRMLEEVREGSARLVAWGIRRMARDVAWSSVVDRADLGALEADARLIVGALLATIDPPRAAARDTAMVAGHHAAMSFGALAGGRGVALGPTVEACTRLRHIVMHQLSIVGRRHEIEVTAATRWLDAASRASDALLADVIRSHERAAATRRA